MLIIFVVVSLFVTIHIVSLERTHKWLDYLRDRFWLLRIVWSNCWGTDLVLLTLTEPDIYGGLINLCWSLFEDKGFSLISLFCCRLSFEILTSVFGVGESRFNSTWYDKFICNQSYTTFKICIYGRESLSVVSLPTTYISIYQ